MHEDRISEMTRGPDTGLMPASEVFRPNGMAES